jgi:hypothetical protein
VNHHHGDNVVYSSPKEKSVSGTKHAASFLSVYLQGDSMYSLGLIPGGTVDEVE